MFNISYSVYCCTQCCVLQYVVFLTIIKLYYAKIHNYIIRTYCSGRHNDYVVEYRKQMGTAILPRFTCKYPGNKYPKPSSEHLNIGYALKNALITFKGNGRNLNTIRTTLVAKRSGVCFVCVWPICLNATVRIATKISYPTCCVTYVSTVQHVSKFNQTLSTEL